MSGPVSASRLFFFPSIHVFIFFPHEYIPLHSTLPLLAADCYYCCCYRCCDSVPYRILDSTCRGHWSLFPPLPYPYPNAFTTHFGLFVHPFARSDVAGLLDAAATSLGDLPGRVQYSNLLYSTLLLYTSSSPFGPRQTRYPSLPFFSPQPLCTTSAVGLPGDVGTEKAQGKGRCCSLSPTHLFCSHEVAGKAATRPLPPPPPRSPRRLTNALALSFSRFGPRAAFLSARQHHRHHYTTTTTTATTNTVIVVAVALSSA